MFDTANFHVSDYGNKQNSCYWAAENPNLYKRETVTQWESNRVVCCTIQRNERVSPCSIMEKQLLWRNNGTSAWLKRSWTMNYRIIQWISPQDGAHAQTVRISIYKFSGNLIMSVEEGNINWPARSPDLRCVTFLSRFLKIPVYCGRSHSISDH